MADAEWAAVRPLLPVPGWLAGWLNGRGGRPEGYCHRQLLDAIRYLVAGGICWRAMPADLPKAMAALPGNQPSGFAVSGGAALRRVARELPRQSAGAPGSDDSDGRFLGAGGTSSPVGATAISTNQRRRSGPRPVPAPSPR
ncbi:transposase [Streptomyces sp. NPDC003860]